MDDIKKNLDSDGLSIEEQIEATEAVLDGLETVEAIPVEGESNELKEQYDELLRKYTGDHRKTLFEFCFNNNICYSIETFKKLTKEMSDEVLLKMPQIYLEAINSDEHLKDVSFFSQIKQKNFEKVYSVDYAISFLSEDDKKNRQIVIDIFSYDPFKEDSIEDQPQLYRDLAGMSNEGMRKDIAKQKAALSIVRSYSNIEKYQKKVRELTNEGSLDEDAQKQLESYMKVISNIQASVNQTAEKNNFTVKGIGSSGKGMLSDVMGEITEKGIDEGVTNFYDIATSKSIEEVANISFKAQLNQINLSKTDYSDILAEQCKIVKESQAKAAGAMEALRIAKEKIVKQELLDELAMDYKKKGISEREIREFISREYKLFDGEE